MRADILSRSQRNEVFQMVQHVKLDPSDFDWSVKNKGKDDVTEVLRHSPTRAFMEFSHFQGGGYWLAWYPDLNGERYEGCRTWDDERTGGASRYVFEWLKKVREDHEVADLWGEVKKSKAIPEAAQRSDYEKQFSAAEIKQLEAALADIETYIATTQPLDASEKQEVHKHFEYLLGAAKKGARKIDWLNIFVGQMVAMVVAGLLDPKVYGPVMAHAAQALNAIFQLGLKLLQ